MRLKKALWLFRKALNSEEFTALSEGRLGTGRRGWLFISEVGSAETPAARWGAGGALLPTVGSAGWGREARSILMFAVGSAGMNELSICWPGIRIAKMQRTAGRKTLFRRKGLRRDRAGRPLESIRRFSS
jgi:hypothetical protein